MLKRLQVPTPLSMFNIRLEDWRSEVFITNPACWSSLNQNQAVSKCVLWLRGLTFGLRHLHCYRYTQQLSVSVSSAVLFRVFLAVIQRNLCSYPTLLKRQIPEATYSHPRQLMKCLFAQVTPECLRQYFRGTNHPQKWRHHPRCLTLISTCLLCATGNRTHGYLVSTEAVPNRLHATAVRKSSKEKVFKSPWELCPCSDWKTRIFSW